MVRTAFTSRACVAMNGSATRSVLLMMPATAETVVIGVITVMTSV